MTVSQFIEAGSPLVALFSEGTIRLLTQDDGQTAFADREVLSVDLRTDNLDVRAEATQAMLDSGFFVSTIDSDGATLNVNFLPTPV